MSTLTRKELEQFAAVAPRLKFGNLVGVLD
jgi:hypothetical protein